MRMVRWIIFATLAASVVLLVSAAARAQDQGGTREFSVTGSQFAYQPAELRVHRDDLVKVTFTAADIAHSFTIDEYRISKRAGAGQAVTFEFRADRTGRFPFYCNLTQDERCRNMKGVLVVE